MPRWGVYMCTCAGRLPADAQPLRQAGHTVLLGDDPQAAAPAFARAAREAGVERVLIGCCGGTAPFEAAFAAAGFAPQIELLDLRSRCFAPHADAEAANAKALRLVRGAMRAAERRSPPPENPFHVGSRIVLVSDDPAGLALAPPLGRLGELAVFAAGAAVPAGGRDGGVQAGRLDSVTGRLGRFAVTLQVPGRDGQPATRSMEADQVVVVSGASQPSVKRRTGLHLLGADDPAALAAAPQAVQELIGDFLKPEHVAYDAAICAGGSAQLQACGRCITACPYDAVSRDPEETLRILLHHDACEGCGACVAACPTGALAFTEPARAELFGRLTAMLAADTGAPPGRQVVVFHCGEQGRQTLEQAGEQGWGYAPATLPIEVPCLRFVGLAEMLGALGLGAAGVALLGCEECQHGERALLQANLALAQQIAGAFGLGAQRLRLLTAATDNRQEAVRALDSFAGGIEPTPLRARERYHAGATREIVADAIAAFIEQLDREPGGLELPDGAPFAWAEVREAGCTLCRSCANACPTHAFRFDVDSQTLSFRHIDCVACGLCERVCPERVIALQPALYLERMALQAVPLVQDEMVHCARCDKPYVNRRALETVEARVLALPALLDTFAGTRRGLLRMCPDCRAVAASAEMMQGWEP